MTKDQARARIIIDDSYREFARPECYECRRVFTPTSETSHYCSGDCAWVALQRRLSRQAIAPEIP